MKDLGDQIHGMQLKFGIYSSAGTMTCQRRAGSLYHEEIDAADFSSWGVDYLKLDNCYNKGVPATTRYGDMSKALKSQANEIYFSICNWGNEGVTLWAPTISNSWRTTQDISRDVNVWQSMKGNFLTNLQSAADAGPGHWNDPDMLMVGNGKLSPAEEATHFALWAFAKAPLIIGADLTSIADDSLAVLKLKSLIDINQDVLGQQATDMSTQLSLTSDLKAYGARTIDPDTQDAYIAVLFVNWSDSAVSDPISIDLVASKLANSKNDDCTWTELTTGKVFK